MTNNKFIRIVLLLLMCLSGIQAATAQKKTPNIIIIYADDLGYGDLSYYGAKRIATPHIDALAKGGLQFTNAHATSSTCTPSRFSMLTGKYAWRQEGTGILEGNAPLIIGEGATTLPGMLKQAGYRTAVVGKWHLGLGGKAGPDWNADLKPGPLEIGFDYSFIIPATADRVPCVFVENHRVVGHDPLDPIQVSYHGKVGNDPTGYENPEMLKIKANDHHNKTIVDSISRIGFMTGGKQARWKDEDIAETLKNKAFGFIDQESTKPFFLYFATHDIHVPRSPNSRFIGKSGMGLRGDAILQLDWTIGELIAHLKKKGLMHNTMIIFSSDNGPVLADGYEDDAIAQSIGHAAAGIFRGGKYSPYEGGTRIPFIVHWPASVKPGTSASLVSQIDLIASLAKLSGVKIPAGDAPDSFDVLPALMNANKPGRNVFVGHAMNNSLSLIKGGWKYVEEGKELYNLLKDPSEKYNLSREEPDRLSEMESALNEIKKGRNR